MFSSYSVYIVASRPKGTLYIGSTSDLVQRVYQHKIRAADGFTKQHGIDRLVWFEIHQNALAMVTRERQLKKWNRQWKVDLIEKANPDWRDLYPGLLG